MTHDPLAKSRRRRVPPAATLALAGALTGTLGYVGAASLPATASVRPDYEGDQGTQYPSIGMIAMSANRSYNGIIEANSLDCSADLINIMNAVWPQLQASTQNKPEMPRHFNGVSYRNTNCNDTSNNWDYKLQWDPDNGHFYQADTGTYIGGRIHHQDATSSFCAYWGVNGRCGHRDYTQFNLTKVRSQTQLQNQQLVAHEQGHAHDLNDLCGAGSLMSNGVGGCFWGGSYQAFQSSDRTDINGEYK